MHYVSDYQVHIHMTIETCDPRDRGLYVDDKPLTRDSIHPRDLHWLKCLGCESQSVTPVYYHYSLNPIDGDRSVWLEMYCSDCRKYTICEFED